LIVRYATSNKGKTEKIAEIYTKDEHSIERRDIDFQALLICDKLRRAGFKPYIVGGAVRDLLLKKQPKDFDIVTDAYPAGIRKVFRRSRIIGKRFRLVHVYFGENIYEVSTFRAAQSENQDANSFGTMAEDAWRRDFTINALYYCPKEEQIIDFTGGYKDFKKRVVKPILPLDTIFLEDPIRIIRAIKSSVIIDSDISFSLKMKIKKHTKDLITCSQSRVTEEIIKIMKTGHAAAIFKKLASLGILKLIFPNIYSLQKNSRFYENLNNFDAEIKTGALTSADISVLLPPLIESFILSTLNPNNDPVRTMKEVMEDVKSFIRPLTPPNNDIAEAIKSIFKKNNIKLATSPPREKKAYNEGTAKSAKACALSGNEDEAAAQSDGKSAIRQRRGNRQNRRRRPGKNPALSRSQTAGRTSE